MNHFAKIFLILGFSSNCLVAHSAFADEKTNDKAESVQQSEQTFTAGAACMLGDGFVILSGSNLTVYPVTCGSDCRDYPDGGFPTTLFCMNGKLGESDPVLAGGSVEPAVVASQYNGFSRCTALPNPWRRYAQSADRKSCVKY